MRDYMKPTHQAMTICGQMAKGEYIEIDGKHYILVHFKGITTTAHWEVKPETVKKIRG